MLYDKELDVWGQIFEEQQLDLLQSILTATVQPFSELTLSQTTGFRLFQNEKSLQRTIPSMMKMAESSPSRLKTLWEKEKLLIMSNFSFSHSVFKTLVLQTRKNQGLFGKGLKLILPFTNSPGS